MCGLLYYIFSIDCGENWRTLNFAASQLNSQMGEITGGAISPLDPFLAGIRTGAVWRLSPLRRSAGGSVN